MSGLPCVSRLLLLLGLAIGVTRLAAELPVNSYELRRNEAYKVTDNRSPEAEKALLALLRERPSDGGVLFALGRALLQKGDPLEPGSERRQLRKQAREYFVQAQKAGFSDPLIATTLASINTDGSENLRQMSQRKEVDRLLQEGEAHFTKRDFSQAIAKYQEACQLEPGNYFAVLYTGDAYFASGQNAAALEWFDKAAAVDPNRESAQRYAGDVLLRMGKRSEALSRYVAAIVAEPYSGYPWRALNQYCQANLIKAWTTPASIPGASITEVDGKRQIGVPKESTPFDLAYGISRLAWQEENRAKKFPPGSKYRLTLEEESYALRQTLKVYREIKQSGKPPPPEMASAIEKSHMFLDHLVKIEAAGLLEAHILLVRVNADLAQDYAAYREAHRDLLRDYLTRFYLHLP